MKQYCRYCGYMVVGDANYCTKQERCVSDAAAKSPNRCHDFAYNPIDAFGENEKGYQPRVPKKTQCDGQMSLFDIGVEHSGIDKKADVPTAIDFSCFSCYRSRINGVSRGECVADHQCSDCEAYQTFYEKAEEYQAAGNKWEKSVALAKRFFGIPTVPEYDVEMYR